MHTAPQEEDVDRLNTTTLRQSKAETAIWCRKGRKSAVVTAYIRPDPAIIGFQPDKFLRNFSDTTIPVDSENNPLLQVRQVCRIF